MDYPQLTVEEQANEYFKCRTNILYFLYNYVHVDETGGIYKYGDTFHPKFHTATRLLNKFNKVIVMASRQLGKALSIDTPIKIHDNTFKTMKDIQVGDIVFDEYGQHTKVIKISDIMENRNCYKIQFSTGESIIADENHLWKLNSYFYGFKDTIIDTKMIFSLKQYLNIPSAYVGNNINIINIEETDSVLVKCIKVDNPNGMFLCGKTNIPTHNSTWSAACISWALVFYPKIRAVILNMKQTAGKENLSRIRSIIYNLPNWMVTDKPFKSKSEIKTYLDLFNDSHVEVFYPSTIHSPSTLARSLTAPILYIDEAAFIRNMKQIYGSAQPILSKASEQAARNKYPYFQIITCTPNGTYGDGQWFYDRYVKSIDEKEFFDKDLNWLDDNTLNSLITNKSKNGYPSVKFHWSEDPTKDEAWYNKQCQDLSDTRLINQELDLLFVGGTNCIFSDETLSNFKASEYLSKYECGFGSVLEIYEDKLDDTDYYIIGCDTAESLEGAFCVIQIYSFRSFNQIAELQYKFGSYFNFGEAIHIAFQWLYAQVGARIILAVENNSIGRAPIEYLLYHIKDFNYDDYLFKMKDNNDVYHEEYGIKTTASSKPMLVGSLLEAINENIKGIRSINLITQFSTIEKTNTGSIRSNTYSDLFMASTFCAFSRRRSMLEIMPQLQYTNKQITKNFEEITTSIIQMSKPQINTKNPNIINYEDEDFFVNEGSNNIMDTIFSSSNNDIEKDIPFIPFFEN